VITLRPDQQIVLDETREHVRAGRRPVMVAPCGWGKGTTFAKMVQAAVERERHVLFLINNCEILRDFSRRLDRIGVDHGVIQANHPRRRPDLRTHVATIQTLHRREKLPKAELILLDEGHFSTSPTFKSVLERYRGVPLVGATATPQGPNGIGLKGIFDALVFGPSTRELTDLGLLVPVRTFAPSRPDLSHVDKTGGDWNQKQLAAVMDQPKLVGDCLEHWLRIAPGRPTVGFATGVNHSKHLRDIFKAAGVKAEHADAKTPPDVRDALWEDLAKGRVQVAWNVGLTTYGWDLPAVSCIILDRPSESLTLTRQMIGRGMRPAPFKADCIVLDHAGAVHRHGFIDDDPDWTLEGKVGARRKDDLAPSFSVRTCEKCWLTFKAPLTKCPNPDCDWEYVPRVAEIKVADGELTELARPEPKPYKIQKLSANPAIAHFQQIAEARGFKHTYAWAMYEKVKAGSYDLPADVFDQWQEYLGSRREVA
jgi:DNA repair protein RadD